MLTCAANSASPRGRRTHGELTTMGLRHLAREMYEVSLYEDVHHVVVYSAFEGIHDRLVHVPRLLITTRFSPFIS